MIPSSKIERTSRGIIHCYAECRACDWKNETVKAARAATKHVRETGHAVSVDIGEVYTVRVKRP